MPYAHTNEHVVFERLHEWQDQAEQQRRLAPLRRPYLSRVQRLIGSRIRRAGNTLFARADEKRAAEGSASDRNVE